MYIYSYEGTALFTCGGVVCMWSPFSTLNNQIKKNKIKKNIPNMFMVTAPPQRRYDNPPYPFPPSNSMAIWESGDMWNYSASFRKRQTFGLDCYATLLCLCIIRGMILCQLKTSFIRWCHLWLCCSRLSFRYAIFLSTDSVILSLFFIVLYVGWLSSSLHTYI